MSFLFRELLYRPIFNLLVALYNFIPGGDFGLAIIVLTLLIRLTFSPFSIKATRSQKKLAELQPRIKEIQDKHKNDKTVQGQKIMELYQKENINPMSGCMFLIIQIPILFGLYRALLNMFNPDTLNLIYNFIPRPEMINNIAFGFLKLAEASPALAIATGIIQFLQMKMQASVSTPNQGSKQEGMAAGIASMSKQMVYFLPVMIIVIGWRLPAGLLIYWMTSTLFSLGEQLYIKKFNHNAVGSK